MLSIVRSCAYDYVEIIELGLENVTEGAQEDWLLQDHHENYNENEVHFYKEYLSVVEEVTIWITCRTNIESGLF